MMSKVLCLMLINKITQLTLVHKLYIRPIKKRSAIDMLVHSKSNYEIKDSSHTNCTVLYRKNYVQNKTSENSTYRRKTIYRKFNP